MTVIHETYLPFSADLLGEKHFAPVASGGSAKARTRHYLESAARAAAYAKTPPTGTPAQIAKATGYALQMQKDEKFWVVTALMKIFYSAEKPQQPLAALLSRALGPTPPFPGCATWAEALGDNPRLYFEVNLPSPPSYKNWLRANLAQRSLVPYLRDPAIKSGKHNLESATKADAMIVAPDTGFAVVFEAKVLSDVSVHIRYDAARNQIARTLDVLMDQHHKIDKTLTTRDPQRSCFVLLTPQLFKDEPASRLYGWLMDAYRKDDELLGQHLPHRDRDHLAGTSRRLGWLSWEECNLVLPGACPWLLPASDAPAGEA